MARVEFGGGVVNIVGSISGNTFQSNRSGYIIRSRGFSRKNITFKQNQSLNDHQGMIYNWSLLSFANKLTWDGLAAATGKVNKYGQTKFLSGFNWYCSCNYARLLCGLSLLSSAPVATSPASVPTYTISLDSSGMVLVIDTPQTITDNYMIIRATPPIRNKTTSFRSQTKLIKCVQSDYWDDQDITSDWETATGLSYPPSAVANSFQIGFMIQSVNINSGISSEGSLFIEAYS